MQKQWSLSQSSQGTLAAIILLVSGVAAGFATQSTVAAEPSAAKDSPKPLPKEIVRAWQETGAKVGWMGINEFGLFLFSSKPAGLAGMLPAFQFDAWKGGVSKLPDPGTPFALNLGGTKVTDTGLRELAGLKSLQSLDLHKTKVTDEGLKELAGFMRLQTLDVSRTNVTDAGLKELVGLKSLRSLYLSNTRVTDAGLKELAELEGLQSLHLYNTKMTDAGLKELAGLTSLQSLYVENTRVTDAGVEELKKALPGCLVHHDRIKIEP